MQGPRLIWAAILGTFGGFTTGVNAGYLFFYEQCMANSTCADSAPSSNSDGLLSLLIGLLLIWGALHTLRPGRPPSALALWIVVLLCGTYIAVPLLHAKGVIGFSWAPEIPTFNMIAAGVVLILTLKRLRG